MFRQWQNKLEKRIENTLDQTSQAKWFSFEWVLLVLSKVYTLGVRIRLWLFEKRIFQQRTLPCFVISIGNITVGGTGKTPMALYLAQTLIKAGKKPVLVSRGYKGTYKTESLVVSDGVRIFSTAQECGDEPYMMAQQQLCPVVVGKNRFKAGQKAIEMFNPDVIILDDGFQHLGLKRDLDLLLFDHANPLGNNKCLPAGRLRETPQMAAKRAHAILLTRCPLDRLSDPLPSSSTGENHSHTDNIDKSIQIINRQFPNLPRFKTGHVPFVCDHIFQDKTVQNPKIDVGSLKGKNAVLFSGIAKNTSFYQTMVQCGVNIVDHLEFKDHYRYKKSDLEQIKMIAHKKDVDIILTTQKDWSKLMHQIEWRKDLVVVGIQIQFEASMHFQSFLNEKMDFI